MKQRLVDLMSSDRDKDEDAILNAINAGLIVLDRNERVTHWNAWMEAASGCSLSYARGKLLTDIFSGVDLKRLFDNHVLSGANRRFRNFSERRIDRRDDDRIYGRV